MPGQCPGSLVITLNRTDTTLDLSQKAEKGMIKWGGEVYGGEEYDGAKGDRWWGRPWA